MRYRITIAKEIDLPSGETFTLSNVFEQILEDIDVSEVAIAINEAAISSRESTMKLGGIEFPKLTKNNQPR